MSVVMLTKTPLQANMSYIQAGRDRFESGIPAGSVSGLVWADKAGTLYLEESDDDGVTWSQTTNVSVSASTTTVLPWTALTKQQYRFRYVNGAAAQTKFRLVQQTRGMELTTVDLSPLENRIDAITSGDTPATAQLTGSNLEAAAVVNVTVAGTRQQLPDKACREVTIIAKRGNTGYIYVGKDDVSSTVFGAELGELDSITLAVSNTNQIYIDASVSGEGISYVAI
jgi:hypothetical protein